MSWGTELWDQYENISSHTQNGIDFCEKYVRFIKDRCAIENKYAADLKRLVKNYQPKKKGDDAEDFTYQRGFLKMVHEVHDMAGQHEGIAENLNVQVLKELYSLITELKQERKTHLQEFNKQQNALNTHISLLERSKKQYERSFKESERAQETFKKADADIHLSRAEVEKAKSTMQQKQQICEDHKSDYAQELQKSNAFQKQHYDTGVPQTFQQLQTMEEKRITRVREFIIKTASIEKDVQPIVLKCIEGEVKAAESIDASEDTRIVIEKFKSGFVPPGDSPFEDLSNGNIDFNQTNTPKAFKSDTLGKGTLGSGKNKKRGGLFGGLFSGAKTDDNKDDYSHLPPNQQKKKLNTKIEELRAKVAKETAERDGMLKMRDVYVQNPALGDPTALDKQLEDNARKLDSLRQEMHKYETYLQEAENKNTSGQQELSTRDSSLSLTSSQPDSNPGTPVTSHHRYSSRHSVHANVANPPVAVNDNRQSNHSATLSKDESFDDIDADSEEEFTVIGVCRALYSFEASNEGSIAMAEGEEYSIVEQDQGDGWTRVRKLNGDEGFVPSSYIECTYT